MSPQPSHFDVIVVGAGPAGAACATELARAGRRVALVDKAAFPRDKACGDGLTTAALRRLEALGCDPRYLPSFAAPRELALRSPSGRLALVPLARERGIAAATVARAELDEALVLGASAAGAVLRRAAFVGLSGDQDGLRVLLDDGSALWAPYVIGADGAHSSVRRAVFPRDEHAPGRHGADWVAFRCYFAGARDSARTRLWIWCEEGLLPGYAWCFPLGDGRVNVGAYLSRARLGNGRALQAAWQSVLAGPFLTSLLGPDATVLGAARAWPIPTALSRTDLVARAGRVYFVGDAARSADPFSGEGVAQALEGAHLLAQAIDAHFPAPGRVGDAYLQTLSSSLGRDHALGARASEVVASARVVEAIVAFLDKTPPVARAVGRILFEDFPRRALLAPWSLARSRVRAATPFGEGPRSAGARTFTAAGRAGRPPASAR